MPRKNLTSDQAAFDRIETQKRELLTDKLHAESKETEQPIDRDRLRSSVDDVLGGALGAEKAAQFRTALDANDDTGTKRVKVRLESQQALGTTEAVQHGQRTNPVIDVLDAPRFAASIREQTTAGVHGDVALNRARGSAGEKSRIDFLETATEEQASDAMSNRVHLDQRPDEATGTTDYSNLSIEELDAQMVRESGSPAQQAHQAALDRAAARAEPIAQALEKEGLGPDKDPEDRTAEEADRALMELHGNAPGSGRSYGSEQRRKMMTGE